jgi:uncharacterized protein
MNRETEKDSIIIIDNIIKKSRREIAPEELGYNSKLAELIKGRELFNITRDSNLDGVSSPSFLIRDYNLKPKNIIFGQQTKYDEIFKELKKIHFKNAVFIVTDLCSNKPSLKMLRRITSLIKSKGCVLIWLDHHPWDEEAINSVKDKIDFLTLGENSLYCASEILYVLLCKRTKENKELAELDHVSDFAINTGKYSAIARKLNCAIVCSKWDGNKRNSSLRQIAIDVARKNYNSKLIKKLFSQYNKTEKDNMKSLLNNSKLITKPRYKIAVGFSRRLQANAACAALKKKHNSDISVYIDTETGKNAIRSSEGFNSTILAEGFGGGGHPRASGFSIKISKFNKFNKEGIEKFTKLLESTAAKVYKI